MIPRRMGYTKSVHLCRCYISPVIEKYVGVFVQPHDSNMWIVAS
jgi:hypothetical protein